MHSDVKRQQDVAVACGDVFGCASVDVEVDIVPVGRTDHKHHRNTLLADQGCSHTKHRYSVTAVGWLNDSDMHHN